LGTGGRGLLGGGPGQGGRLIMTGIMFAFERAKEGEEEAKKARLDDDGGGGEYCGVEEGGWMMSRQTRL
jgi:hypothetical protein